jgi:hypothetical protein
LWSSRFSSQDWLQQFVHAGGKAVPASAISRARRRPGTVSLPVVFPRMPGFGFDPLGLQKTFSLQP